MKLHIAKGHYVAIQKATGEEYKIVHCQLDPLTKEIQALTVEDLQTYLQLDIPEEYFNDWEIKEVEEP